jgi:hypothetical protein
MPPLTGVPHILAIAATIIAAGFMVCRVVGGLKDQPVFSDYFAAHPQASLLLNALFSLLTGLSACLALGVSDLMAFVECLLMAAGTFFAASGFHRADKREGPAPPPTGAGAIASAAFVQDVKVINAQAAPEVKIPSSKKGS